MGNYVLFWWGIKYRHGRYERIYLKCAGHPALPVSVRRRLSPGQNQSGGVGLLSSELLLFLQLVLGQLGRRREKTEHKKRKDWLAWRKVKATRVDQQRNSVIPPTRVQLELLDWPRHTYIDLMKPDGNI